MDSDPGCHLGDPDQESSTSSSVGKYPHQLRSVVETIPALMELPVAKEISSEVGSSCREVSTDRPLGRF